MARQTRTNEQAANDQTYVYERAKAIFVNYLPFVVCTLHK